MADHPMPPRFRRCLAAVLAVLIGLGPVATPAYAALTPLGDEPLNVHNSAQPNIVLTVDDSTSMLFDFLPDYVVNNFCRGGLGGMTAACGSLGAASDFTNIAGGKYFSPGYTFQQYTLPYSSYTGTYDASGPGAGCYGGSPPTCSPGINPGALPGIATYPAGPNTSWPNANKPYEYWLMWPAPAHNAALNAIYYDPRLTYEPALDSTGASYPQMDAGNTSTWTQVPADPWASTLTYVDLTAQVTLGLWCNSDWSLGSVTDPTQCRVNGSGAAAFGTVSASQGKDYTYPWAPPGFTLSASPGTITTNTYAGQKVTLSANLTGTATTAAWANAQNQKHFYENENIIWCDPTSPSWPHTGPTQTQTCVGSPSGVQICSAFAGACVNKVTGSCKNAPSCNGLTVGTCSGYLPALCQGVPGVCNNYIAPTCTGGQCLGSGAQTCNGTFQSCNTTAQTCSGPFPQVCNLPGTQTCTTPVCTPVYNPPNCNNLPPDPENPCSATISCTQPVCTPDPGTCSIQTSKSCTQNSDCTPQPGSCSLSGISCMQQSDCGNVGTCNIDHKVCTVNSDCLIIGGRCSKTNQVCTKSSDCPAAGNCKNGGAACLVNQDCPGNCNNPPQAVCTTAATCPAINGLCSNGVTVCQNSGQCPITGGLCQTLTCPDNTTVCTNNNGCTGIGNGQCTAKSCSSSLACQATIGKCTGAGSKNGNACTTKNDCLTQGTCSNTGASCSSTEQCGSGICTDNVTKCLTNAQCPNAGTCNTNGQACSNDNQCPPTNGVCSITNLACTTTSNCPDIGKCSVTNAQCSCPHGTFAAGGSGSCITDACPSTPGPLAPNAAVCSTGGVGGVSTATLRNDADNNGVVCRRNNKAYTGVTAAPYNYPSGKYLTPITNGTGVDACPATDHYASVPRHYWKSEVEWCDKAIATAGDQWLGYGTDVGGTCQPAKDSTHVYPRFYQFGASSYVNNYNTAALRRVDLDISKRASATYTHTWIDSKGQTKTIIRNFDNEMTNYANWFAYYRTRIQAVKTVTSITFAALDKTYRVGFHTFSNGDTTSTGEYDPAKFVNIADFDATQKAAWFKELFAIAIPLRLDTPTLDAVSRIGEYFLNGTSSELPGATDPIILSCQKNWHMLFTDGFTNQPGLPTSKPGDVDLAVPQSGGKSDLPTGRALGEAATAMPSLDPASSGGTNANWPNWPYPFLEDLTGKASDSASDYALYYWQTDLRNANRSINQNNVPGTTKDPATWQHVNFAAMSLGTQGKLPTANQSLTENLLISGALKWPQPYPTVYRPDSSGVDDLWHAAMNGRGRFVNAQSADELKLGMGQILQDITNQGGARAGAGFSISSVSQSNHVLYRAGFQPGWGGDLIKVELDQTTGKEISIDWHAAEELTKQLANGSTPWFTERKIFTIDDAGKAVPFLWANLSAAQQDSLAPGLPATGQAVLKFLRGDPTNEGIGSGQFRVRPQDSAGTNFLGDIVDSQVVYVGPPSAPYLEGNDPGYLSFATNNSARPAQLYVGANDGMLHAFVEATGNEAWAFIPHDLYRADNTGLGALSYQDGALPAFRHHYYVDSTPRIIDVDFGGQDWHSLLVGGLGKGGKSYYALDVTDPASVTTEANAAAQYRWTFTHSDMGYTYGRPMLAKTRAFGGAWLMVVSAGYNNPSGLGRIYFVNAKDGTLLKTMTTGYGNPGSPSGLAHIAGYTKDFRNQLIEQIYGGDLYGNFWRFDVSDPDDSNWSVVKMADLTDPLGNAQPVTTPPQVEVDVENGVDRWVFIGTGRLLDETDLADSQQQTFYAMRDGTATTPNPITTPLAPRTDFQPIIDKIKGLATKPAKGWYDDLPAGERSVTPVEAVISIVAYAGTSAQDNPCLTGYQATLYAREYARGNTLLPDPNDPSGNTLVAGIAVAQGIVGQEVVSFLSATSGNDADAENLDIRVITTSATGEGTFVWRLNLPYALGAFRMSWRLLGQ